jgi:very-short-patch-repair endonuclease
MNFGPLNSEGGQRRLNVAVSRARERVVIFSTLRPEQIDISRVRAAGVRDLKHYLEFALKGPKALLEQSLPTGMEPDSPFESQVIKVLRDHNWIVHPQVGCSGYRIDIGVVDPRAPGRYLIGIECDGRAYHSGATARDRDRLRQVVLEGLGWRLHRIWSTDWWLNPEVEVQKLLARLNKLLEDDADEEAPAAESIPKAMEPETVDSVPSPITRTDIEVSLPKYKIVLPTGGKPEDFYDLAHGRKLTEQLIGVIEAEGPIHENVLHRRVARAWGLERTGTRIVDRLRMLTPREQGRTSEGSATFYWPANVNPAEWGVFREASDEGTSRRKVDDVCLEELANGVLHVLEEMGSAPTSDVARSVCRLIGMSRTPGDAEARVGLAISHLLTSGSVTKSGTLLRLS